MKPDFVVIGAAKCGTTTLFSLLEQHPRVYMPPEKELHFFCRNYHRGWPWYERHFTGATDTSAIGEASTTYTQHAGFPEAAARLIRHLPEARLIYITRHPLRQIESFWMECRRISLYNVPHDFDRAVRTCTPILDTCRYAHQLSFYREHFDDDRVLVLFLEDLQRSPAQVLHRCYRFLGVDPAFEPRSVQEHRNITTRGAMDSRLAGWMRRAPLFNRIAAWTPRLVYHAAYRMLKRPIQARPEWRPDTKARVVDQIAQETRRFLIRHGKPEDFWDLREPP